jgi:diguanylate cyclase (GGDEF)-like protein
MERPRHGDATLSHPLERGSFLAYFLGGVVPLMALGIVIERYVLRPLAAPGGHPVIGPFAVLGLFAAIALLSLSSFFLLRRAVKESLAKIHTLVYYDSLTGLPNRRMYKDRLQQALARARSRSQLVAVCFLDLDGFKRINDTLGHEVGDLLLCHVAERLVASVRSSDSVARLASHESRGVVSRLGGDEFTFLLGGISDARQVAVVAHRVLDRLGAPFAVGSEEVFATASLGIAVYPVDGEDVDALLASADTAMYAAKSRGRNNYQFFSKSMNEAARRRQEIESRLRGALERDELSLHYQPVRDATSGDVRGAEALLRWCDPELGPLSPAEFVPIAEEAGLIGPIGEWVLRRACTQARAWQDAGFLPIRMAVNLSGHQLRLPSFGQTVARALHESGMSPSHLELEITESAIMQNDEATDASFRELYELGVGIVLDDFGTGYSSLSYLCRLPIRRLKIDRSFVAELPAKRDDVILAQTIIAMARSLGLGVVAEGVETLAQVECLRALGCDDLQGHLFSRAVPADAFERFLEREKRE